MQNEQDSLQIVFKPDFQSPSLDVAQADYHRVFNSSEQPFTVSKQEMQHHLDRLGVFVIYEHSAPAVEPETNADSIPEEEPIEKE
ncbi:MAG TPA: hypothetical protein VFC63_09800 [Blastocatellia bacterium]|nr:hypothetical protein [Blastocatellia bacterium]